MNKENGQKYTKKGKVITAGRECAYLAVFVALLLASQLVFAAIPGVELVTVLFVAFSFSLGVRRGVLAATAFSLLRQLIFGFFPNVLILYLLYYNLLALLFGFLGKKVRKPVIALWWLTLLACLCSVCFSLLDNIVTPLWYAYTKEAARAYFLASISVLFPQVICTAVTVGVLFLPLQRASSFVKR